MGILTRMVLLMQRDLEENSRPSGSLGGGVSMEITCQVVDIVGRVVIALVGTTFVRWGIVVIADTTISVQVDGCVMLSVLIT
jgi:hypothetical protein